jgi:hypothetical protein
MGQKGSKKAERPEPPANMRPVYKDGVEYNPASEDDVDIASVESTIGFIKRDLFKHALDLEMNRAGHMICDAIDEIEKFKQLNIKMQEVIDQSITTSDSEMLTVSDVNVLILKNRLIALQACLQMKSVVTNALNIESRQDQADVLFLHFSYMVLSVLRTALFLVGIFRAPHISANRLTGANSDFRSTAETIRQKLFEIGGYEGMFLDFDPNMQDPQGRRMDEKYFNFDGDSHGMINSDAFATGNDYADNDPFGFKRKIESTVDMLDELIYWRGVEDYYIDKEAAVLDSSGSSDNDKALIDYLGSSVFNDLRCNETDGTGCLPLKKPKFEKLLEIAKNNTFIAKAKKLKLNGAHKNDLSTLNENLIDAEQQMCMLPVGDPIRQEIQNDYNAVAAMSEIVAAYYPEAQSVSREQLISHFDAARDGVVQERVKGFEKVQRYAGDIQSSSSRIEELQTKHRVATANRGTGYGQANAVDMAGLENEITLHKDKIRSYHKAMPTGSPLLTSFKKAYREVLERKKSALLKIEKYLDGVLPGKTMPKVATPATTAGNETARADAKRIANEKQAAEESTEADSSLAKKERYAAEMNRVTDPGVKAYLEAYFALLEDIETLNKSFSAFLEKIASTTSSEPAQVKETSQVVKMRIQRETKCAQILFEKGLVKYFLDVLEKVENIVKEEFNEVFKECVKVYEDSMRFKANDEGTLDAIDHKTSSLNEQLSIAQAELMEIQNSNTEKLNAFRDHLREKGLYQSNIPGADNERNELETVYERIAGFAPSGQAQTSEDLINEFRAGLERAEEPLQNTIKTLSESVAKMNGEGRESNFILRLGTVSSPISPIEISKKRVERVKKYTLMQSEYDAFISTERTAQLKEFVADIYAFMQKDVNPGFEVDIISREKCADCLAKVVLYLNDLNILLKLSRRVSEAIRLISSTTSKCMLNMNDAFVKRMGGDDITATLPTLSIFINQTATELTSCVDTKINDSIKGELLATISFVNTILANYSQKQGEGVLSNVVSQRDVIFGHLEYLQDFQERYQDDFTRAIARANSLVNPIKKNMENDAEHDLPSTHRKLMQMQKKVFQSRVLFGKNPTNFDIGYCRDDSSKVHDTHEYITKLVAEVQTVRDRIVEDIHGYYKVFENQISNNLTSIGSYVSEKSKLTSNENSKASSVERVKMITGAGVAGAYFDKITEYMNDPLITSVLYSFMSQKNRVVEKVLRYNYLYINPLSLIPTFRFKGLVNWLMQNNPVPFEGLSPEMQNGMVLIALDHLDTMRRNLEEQQEALQYRSSLLEEDAQYPSHVAYKGKSVKTYFIEFVLPQLNLNTSSINLESSNQKDLTPVGGNMVRKEVFIKAPNAYGE